MNKYIRMTVDNVAEVAEATGRQERALRQLLNEAHGYGVDHVNIPIENLQTFLDYHNSAVARIDHVPVPEGFGFRRRCAWCGRILRGWQLNLCRTCKAYASDPHAGPPCYHGAHWDHKPDDWSWGFVV